jgi:hypothetical protein
MQRQRHILACLPANSFGGWSRGSTGGVGEVHLPAYHDTSCCNVISRSFVTGCHLTCYKIVFSGRRPPSGSAAASSFFVQSLIASLSARTFYIEQTEGAITRRCRVKKYRLWSSIAYEPAIGYVRYLPIDRSDSYCRRSLRGCIYLWG